MNFLRKSLRSLKNFLLGLVMAIISFGVIVTVTTLWPPSLSPRNLAPGAGELGTITLMLLILLGGWIATAIHELGHALAAKLNGFRLEQFAVLPLVWWKPAYRAKPVWKLAPGIFSGQIRGVPLASCVDVRAGHIRVVASGPFASLLAAFFVVIPATTSVPPVAAVLFMSVAGFSLLNLVIALIPYTSGTCDSDGKQLLDLGLKRLGGEITIASVTLVGQFEKRFDGSDLDASLIDILVNQDENRMARFNGHFFAAIKAGSNKDLESIARCTQSMTDEFEHFPREIQSVAAWQVVVFAARCGEIDRARKYFDLVPASSREPWKKDYLEARIAMSEGDDRSATRYLASLRKKIQSPVYSEKWKQAVFRDIDEIEVELHSKAATEYA